MDTPPGPGRLAVVSAWFVSRAAVGSAAGAGAAAGCGVGVHANATIATANAAARVKESTRQSLGMGRKMSMAEAPSAKQVVEIGCGAVRLTSANPWGGEQAPQRLLHHARIVHGGLAPAVVLSAARVPCLATADHQLREFSMFFATGLTQGVRVAARAALVALVTIAALPVVAVAQGGGMGGFGGSGGMGGGGGGHGHGHGMGSSSNSSAPNVSKHFEDLASLKDAVKHIDGLTKDQKDAFPEIERGYNKLFKPMGETAQQLVDSAHAAHERPDRQRMDSLRQQAKDLRERELNAARNILTTNTQRDQFDRNVAQIHEDEAKREEEMQQQMSNVGQHSGTR